MHAVPAWHKARGRRILRLTPLPPTPLQIERLQNCVHWRVLLEVAWMYLNPIGGHLGSVFVFVRCIWGSELG